jgi:hypothetical protein
MFQTEVVEKIIAHILRSVTFLRKSCSLRDNVKTFVRFGEVKEDNIMRSMRVACWEPKATNTRSKYVILIAFPPQQCWHERATLLRHTT